MEFKQTAAWSRIVVLAGLAALPLAAVGCGSSGKSAATTRASKASAAAPAAKTPATKPAASSSTNVPELIICEADSQTSGELDAFSSRPTGVTSVLLTHFAARCSESANLYTFSSDLSKMATTSQSSDGSTVAGYDPANNGTFVDLSGHHNNSYSNAQVTDSNPLFNPATGELWWNSNGHMWAASASGGPPEDEGPGEIAAFTASGEPLQPNEGLVDSPGGLQAAVRGGNNGTGGPSLAIAKPNVLTPACQKRVLDTGRQCPGVTMVPIDNDPNGSACKFTGFVSNSEFVCLVGGGGGEQFDLFSIDSSKHRATYTMALTPPTNLKLGRGYVSPDGKTLWYTGIHEDPEETAQEQLHLFVVPTDSYSAEPSPAAVTAPESLNSNGAVIAWRWHGHLLPGND
jgi:hypothetical protein